MSTWTWTVYGSQPAPVTVRSERQARRLARKYARLGMHSDLYQAGGDGELALHFRLQSDGREWGGSPEAPAEH